ncbi:sideroflexin 5 [Stylonychia lemnae]|uniref:Sideroflexin 5 n=1 Tax=Stylonychia lemnae TaxID=5949 RepID=A0A078B9R6_STYLE|nr:sideroflexin 5 [Stylonychia lemnae]|eukprot:CDW90303.1 sideroflexin 5 [Stylonychia lemnae]
MQKSNKSFDKKDYPDLPDIDINQLNLDIKNLPPLPDHIQYKVAKAPVADIHGKLKKLEESEFKNKKPFTLKRSEFNVETYWGRFRHQFSRINPSLFFVNDKKIRECLQKVEKFKIREEASDNIGAKVYLKQEEIDELIYANRVVGSAVHPDTKQINPPWFRMSSFVLFNVPLVFLVLFAPNQTPAFNASLQGMNQTYNAMMNYGNRNASSPYTNEDILKGYAFAVLTSGGIALYSRKLLASKLKALKGARLILANSALGYLAGAFAGVGNVVMMRSKELKDGIQLQNEEGDVNYGNSKVAAQQAIFQTGLSRFVLALPVLFFPALANLVLEKFGLWPKRARLANLIELILCACSLTVALPMSVALFNQRSMLPRESLEAEFQDLKDSKGEVITHFYFNKGL